MLSNTINIYKHDVEDRKETGKNNALAARTHIIRFLPGSGHHQSLESFSQVG